MAIKVQVRFTENGKAYDFDAEGFADLEKGDFVLVDSNDAAEFAVVTGKPVEIQPESMRGELKRVLRKATKEDIATHEKWRQQEQDARKSIEDKVRNHGLDMKLCEVKYSFDGSKILISYTSDDRVDFRELVRDLASLFRTRVELRQIGARDEAKVCGGYGPCGQEICCRRFLDDYTQVSIKMAKAQGLSLNPNKINGVCGKLMCCLEYEFGTYRDLQSKLPQLGTRISTADGEGEVTYQDILKQRVTLKFVGENGVEFRDYGLEELKF